MRVDVREAGDVIIVDLKGRLVAGVGDVLLREVINELLAENWKKILLNLSELNYVDSSGVGELVSSLRTAKTFGATIRATRLNRRIQRILRLAYIVPLLEICNDEAEALERFASTPTPEDVEDDTDSDPK